MEVLGMIIFWIFLIVGVIIIPLGFGGTFLIVIDVLIYGLITRFSDISLPFVLTLLAIALGVELIELIFGAILAKKFGGSKWGMLGAILGGFIGALIGTPVMPVLGTLIGGFMGAFVGATLLEWIHTNKLNRGFRVGLGAFFGALGGKVTKLIAAIIMVILVMIRLY